MKAALLVWGGWDGYEPEKDAKLFASFLQSQEYQTTISDTLDIYLDKFGLTGQSDEFLCIMEGK